VKTQDYGVKTQEYESETQEYRAETLEYGAETQEYRVKTLEYESETQEYGAKSQDCGVKSKDRESKNVKKGPLAPQNNLNGLLTCFRQSGQTKDICSMKTDCLPSSRTEQLAIRPDKHPVKGCG